MSDGNKPSFWTTLPGILTAVAAILGSIVTIITIVMPLIHPAPVAPEIAFFTAAPAEIDFGDIVSLEWEMKTAPEGTRITIEPGIGDVGISGHRGVMPNRTTTYTLSASNSKKTVSLEKTVIVRQSPGTGSVKIDYFSVSPAAIDSGEIAALEWKVSGPADTMVAVDHGVGRDLPLAGSHDVTPPSTTKYTLSAVSDEGGSDIDDETVYVNEAPAVQPPEINYFIVTPKSISSGDSADLEWDVSSTASDTEISIDPEIGSVKRSGSTPVWPIETMTYTLTAENKAGKDEKQVTVAVTLAPEPEVPAVEGNDGVEPIELGIVSFVANPAEITSGESSTLEWIANLAEGDDKVYLETSVDGQVIDSKVLRGRTGETFVTPTRTTTYKLSASGDSRELTVTVSQAGSSAVLVMRNPSIRTIDSSKMYLVNSSMTKAISS